MIHGHPTLVFEPSEELVFRDKLGHVTGVQLIIKNKNLEEIYFKVKSTASKFYSVRPSSGTIKPHGQVKVVIQPHDDSVKALDVIEENNHRFMIQSSFVDTKAPKTAEDFWQNLDKSKIPVTTAKLHVRVKRLEPSSSNEAINGSKFEHKQGLVDQHEAFALAHFHVQNGAKENAKATNSGKNVKYDHVNKIKDDALNNITPVIPLVRNASINETIGLEEPAKEKQNVKNVQTNVTQTKEFVAIGKEVQVDNKEVNNSPKNESKLKESPTKPIINNEVMVETEEIEKLTTLNLGSSNAGECKEEMRAQLLTSPLPNNQPTQLTFANTSMIDGKIDNFSTSMVKPQQQPLFNPSQFCYYPMHFMDSAFHGGVENGNGYYGRYIASVLDKMPKKMTISLKRDIAELIAKYEQQVAESEEDYVLKH